MLKKQLQRWLPEPEKLLKNRTIKVFAPHLADPRLWHFNRRCLSKAVYIGVMSAFFPLPGQMPIATIAALYFRANLPMAVMLTWITNPLTSIPIFYFAYWLGALLVDAPMIDFKLIGEMLSAFSLWIFSDGSNPFVTFRQSISLTAFIVGLTILSVVSGVVSGLAFRIFWRWRVVNMWKKRHGYRPPHLLKK